MLKRTVLVLPVVLVLAQGCSSSGGKTPTPAAAEKQPTPEELGAEESRKLVETVRQMAGLPAVEATDEERPASQAWAVVKDEKTGKLLHKVPKAPPFRSVKGRLVSDVLHPSFGGLEIVREDESFFYVPVPEKVPDAPAVPPESLRDKAVLPPEEYEVVTPRTSSKRLRFEERSEGLPTSGFWRSNMSVADLDADGSPEIVTPPPRLSSGTFRVFRYDGARWAPVVPTLTGETDWPVDYGAATVHDVDGDGRPDVVLVGHGAGPVVAFNEGGFRFRLESRTLPREMTSRAIAAGDVDGDGLVDLLAISDEPETVDLHERLSQSAGRKPALGEVAVTDSGYAYGRDFRAFFAVPEKKFVENSAGLESACFGYTLALDAAPRDGGAPFFASGCRFTGGTGLLYEFDRAGKTFRFAGRGVVERAAYHGGAATLTYAGLPAAAVTFSKVDARGAAERPIKGHGVSVYYRDGATWKRKRVSKVLTLEAMESQGLGTGDLDGDGLDDIVWADDASGRVRVFFQTKSGEFEELDPALQPRHVNYSMSVKIADVDRDGRNDVVLMYEFRTNTKTRAGGLRYFRNAG